IILIYHKPLSCITNRLQPINKRIVRFDCSLDRSLVRLFQAHRLQKLSSDISHGLSGFEVFRFIVWGIETMEDFGEAEFGSDDACCISLLFGHLGSEVESAADAFF